VAGIEERKKAELIKPQKKYPLIVHHISASS
jgi:hypothetical protein